MVSLLGGLSPQTLDGLGGGPPGSQRGVVRRHRRTGRPFSIGGKAPHVLALGLGHGPENRLTLVLGDSLE